MILFYTVVLILLGVTHWLVQRRAAALGRAYGVLADKALKLMHGPRKPGNAAHDVCAHAKQQFELGAIVSRRDRAEAKHYAWQTRADWLGKAVIAVRNWKGQKLPYSFGVLDVWIVLYLIDHFGFGDVMQPRHVVETVVAWFKG